MTTHEARLDDAPTVTPRVSAFMTVYNGDLWIEEAVRSVLDQSEPDFELIVIDDGSTDDTRKILESIIDPRIHLIHKENEGLGLPLNPWLRRCTGEYIMRLDGDDICDPERMRLQADFLDEHPDVVIVGCQLHHFVEAGDTQTTTLPLGHKEILQGLRHGIHTVSHPTTMWRRSLLDDIDGYLWPGAGEDWSLLLEAARYGKLANLPGALYSRRLHPGSSSASGGEQVLQGFAFARKRYEKFLEGEMDYTREQYLQDVSNSPLDRFSLAARSRSMSLHRDAQAARFSGNNAKGMVLLGAAAILNPRTALGTLWKLRHHYASQRQLRTPSG